MEPMPSSYDLYKLENPDDEADRQRSQDRFEWRRTDKSRYPLDPVKKARNTQEEQSASVPKEEI